MVQPMAPKSCARGIELVGEAEAAEVQRLYDGCRTNTADTGVVQRLKFLMRISQLELASETPDSPALNNMLQVFPSSHFLTRRLAPEDESKGALHATDGESASGARTFQRHIIAGSWFLVAFLARGYVLFKFAIIAAILSRRDYLRGHIELDVRQNASDVDSCMLQEDSIGLVGDNLVMFKEHEKLTRWAKFFGASFLSVPGLASLLAGMSTSLPVTFLAAAAIYFRLQRVRVDHLCFIFDPVGERRRIKHELDTIVKELIGSLSNRRHFDPDATGSRSSSSFDSRRSSLRLPHERLSIARDEQESRLERLRFIQLLVLINRLQLVRPCYVTNKWHRKLVWLTGRLIWLQLMAKYGTMTLMFTCLVLHDLYETTRLRVSELICRQWGSSGANQINMLDSAHLEPLNEPALAGAYESNDGSIASLLRLALTVEAANYFSLKRLVFILEIYSGFAFVSLWGVLAGVIYLSGIMNKIVWLRQLERQIDLAAIEAAEHAKHTIDQGGKRLVDSEDRLLRTLTVAYLHYELFRRQEREFQVFVRLSLIRFFVMLLTGLAILYLVALNVNSLNRLVLIYWYAAMLVVLNAYLLAASYKAKYVERIKRKVARIVAHCAASRTLQMSYALELWCRQLHFDHIEADLFGKHISYENVISFNAHTIATFLILIRVISYKA